MSVYKLAATGTGGTQNAAAQLDIQFDGLITGMHGMILATLVAGGDQAIAEASFLSVNTIGSNDTRGSLLAIGTRLVVLDATGNTQNAENTSIGGLAIVVNAGERIWLHIAATASRASQVEFYFYVEDGQVTPTAARRR